MINLFILNKHKYYDFLKIIYNIKLLLFLIYSLYIINYMIFILIGPINYILLIISN